MDFNRVSQKWLDAHSDPHSCLYTISRCMALVDLLADGDYKLVLADLGTGTSNIKLKVYKGTSVINETTLIEIPTALVSFYHDHHDQKIPSVALASGSSIYVYKNMKPFYKFSLPEMECNPLETDLWIQARNDGISPSVLHNMLSNIKNEIGFSNLSYQSQKFLMISNKNEEEVQSAVRAFAPQPIKRHTVITCMSTLYKNSNLVYSISCLIVGTENGWVHIVDSEAFTILESIDQSSDLHSTDQTVPVIIKTMGLYDVDYRIVVYNRNGKVTLLRRGWTQPKIILHLPVQAVDMCLLPESGNIYLALMDASLECYTKKGKKLWRIKLKANATGLLPIPLVHQGLTLIAVALEGGTVCFYHGKEMVDSLMAADTVAGMVFGRFGQEEHCFVLITISGTLQVKVLKRTAQFLRQGSSSAGTSAQNLKLNIPKKTSLFLEQAGREMNQPIQMHRTFQKDLFRFRLETAREFQNSLNKINNSISNDSTLPLKLSTEVFGLGPTFKILLTLENMSQASTYNIDIQVGKSLALVFHYNPKMYRLDDSFIQLPLLVPGIAHKFETIVRMVNEPNAMTTSEDIHVFIFSEKEAETQTKPLVSAVIHMPVCDVLPIEI